MKLLHTADWQLGARFRQFSERADELREARFTALRRALEIARDRKVDAFVIAGDLVKELEGNRESLRELLASVDCANVSGAHAAFSKRREFQKELEAAEEKLGEALADFDSMEELQSELAALERQAKALRETLSPTASEIKMSVAELEADAERLSVSLKKEQETQSASTLELKKRRDETEQCARRREEADKRKVEFTVEGKGLEEQIGTLKARYSQGLDQAKRGALSHLSQGAKEQLLLCLRLAVAGEVSANGHKLVVLDDVLVNTDGQRQQRVLDLLQAYARQLQILILTCHPENYRGVGEVVEVRVN